MHDQHAAIVYMWTSGMWQGLNRLLPPAGGQAANALLSRKLGLIKKDFDKLMPFISPRMYYFISQGMRTQKSNVQATVLQLYAAWLRPWRYYGRDLNAVWTEAKTRNMDWFETFVGDNIAAYTVLFHDFMASLVKRFPVASFILQPEKHRDICGCIKKVWGVFGENPGLVKYVEKVEQWMFCFSCAIEKGQNPDYKVEGIEEKDHTRALKIFQTRAQLLQLLPTSTDFSVVLKTGVDNPKSLARKLLSEVIYQLFDARKQMEAKLGTIRRRRGFFDFIAGHSDSDDDPNSIWLYDKFFNHLLGDPSKKGAQGMLTQVDTWRPIVEEIALSFPAELSMNGVSATSKEHRDRFAAPWSQPCRSYEVSFLIGPLYRLSKTIDRLMVWANLVKWPEWLILPEENESESDIEARIHKQLSDDVTTHDNSTSSIQVPFRVAALEGLRGQTFVLIIRDDMQHHHNKPEATFTQEVQLYSDIRGVSLTGKTWFLDIFELVEYYMHHPYGTTNTVSPSLVQHMPLAPHARKCFLKRSTLPQPGDSIFPVNLRGLASLRLYAQVMFWAAAAWLVGYIFGFVIAFILFVYVLFKFRTRILSNSPL